MISIAIADDHRLFRKGIAALADTFEGIELAFEAENGRQLLDLCRQNPTVQVILLDLSMPELNGLDTLKILKQDFPALKIIIITIHEGENYIMAAVQAGANGYLAKNAEPEEVEQAIREVVQNDFYFNAPMLDAMRKGMIKKTQPITFDGYTPLTARETEVLQLICKQYSSTEIAEKLFLSHRTVEGHRNNLLSKTGSRNTAGLVLFALKHNLLDPDVNTH